jgi:hypothetical protein
MTGGSSRVTKIKLTGGRYWPLHSMVAAAIKFRARSSTVWIDITSPMKTIVVDLEHASYPGWSKSVDLFVRTRTIRV